MAVNIKKILSENQTFFKKDTKGLNQSLMKLLDSATNF